MSTNQSLIDNKSVSIEQILLPVGVNLLSNPSLEPIKSSIAYDTSAPDKIFVANGNAWYDASTPVTAGNFNSVSTDKGITISNIFGTQEIKLDAADATHPGGVSATAQTFGGDKTFSKVITPIITNAGALSIGPGSSLLDFNNVAIANFAGSLGSGVYSASSPTDATNNFGINIDNGLNRINLLYANASYGGMLSDIDQSVKGTKTFTNSIILPTLSTPGVVHNDALGNLSTSLIVNADVSNLAAISDTKLATISTAGKVLNSATTATPLNTVSTIVERDISGNFSAGTITAALSGNATTATTSTNFSGSLAGDVTGTQSSTTVAFVGTQPSSSVVAGVQLANAATNLNTASAIVKRDASGNFSAGTITANLTGVSTNATTAASFSGSLSGDVTGTQSSTVVSIVGGQTSTNVATATVLANAATNLNTANAIIARDASGDFSCGTMLASTSYYGFGCEVGGFISMPQTADINNGTFRIGLNKFLHAYGGSSLTNTFLGRDAGNYTCTAAANDNAGLGYLSLRLLTSGTGNTASGAFSLYNLTSGSFNTANGSSALGQLTTGSGNVAVGFAALSFNSASNNTAVGTAALTSNSSGTQNTALGYNSLYTNSNASSCTAVGFNALKFSTGASNTAVGALSLSALTTGVNNVALGVSALASATTTSANIAIGNSALTLNTGSNNTAIGASILSGNVTGSNNCAAGYTSLILSTGSNNTAFGYNTGAAVTTGANNIIIGASAGGVLTTGSNNIYIGTNATTAADSGVCKIAQIRGVTTGSPTGIAVLIDANGQLGTVSSVRSKKENIIDMDPLVNYNVVKNLRPRRFDFIGSHGEYQSYGFIVDEVQGICDDIVAKDDTGEPCTIYYQHLPLILLTEVKRLQAIIDRAGLV